MRSLRGACSRLHSFALDAHPRLFVCFALFCGCLPLFSLLLKARVDAYVPVITFKFLGIEFDLLYAQMSLHFGLNLTQNLSFNIYDDQLLRGLDQKTILSLNGARVTDMILSLMPEQTIVNFRLALIFIKVWAKARGIYSNVHGYLGGVSWAILTAQVCQLYPNASASKILEKFFVLYQQWKWPSPVTLNEPKKNAELNLPIWNAKENYKDRQDLMPVLTPAYPCMNSTHNVSRPTLKVSAHLSPTTENLHLPRLPFSLLQQHARSLCHDSLPLTLFTQPLSRATHLSLSSTSLATLTRPPHTERTKPNSVKTLCCCSLFLSPLTAACAIC